MTDREKLITRLNASFEMQYSKRGLLTAQHTANDLISFGVTFATDNNVGRWIPVTERLPDEETSVLLARSYRGNRYVDIGTIKEGMAHCYSDEYKINLGEHKLTHWMPLPEPPKEKENV